MKYLDYKNIDERVLYDKLDNGLEVFILRKKGYNTSSARFFTEFGGLDTTFTPINEKEEVTMPTGIAHFLEHKLFEEETGESAEEFYEKTGSYVNAFTNYNNTCYYFVSTSNFENNLTYLLDFVQSPYLTDENVEKEKGIILEEAKMCLDDPNRSFSENIMESLFKELPYNQTVIGSLEDISSITKEDLYRCYNTFYHPSNMKLIVVTNKKEEDVLKLIKENQDNKEFKKDFKIKKKKYNEPYKVNREYYEFKNKINEERVCYALKLKLADFKYEIGDVINSIGMYLDYLIGSLSDFNLKMKKEKIISGNIAFNIERIDKYIIIKIFAFTNKEIEFIKLLENKFNDEIASEKEFLNLKKTITSSLYYNLNTVEGTMSFLYGEYIFYNAIDPKNLEKEINLNYKTFKDVIKNVKFDNKSIIVMKPLDN